VRWRRVSLPDARRLAGIEGELVLVRDVGAANPHHLGRSHAEPPVGYLETVADGLRSRGARVQTQMLHIGDAAVGIDEAAGIFQADMIAIATHDRSLMHRLLWGGVAWRALAHSPIPVLLRRLETPEDGTDEGEPEQRHTLVPLDGSQLAEKVLPLARQLAREWAASVLLAQAVRESMTYSPATPEASYYYDNTEDMKVAHAYLSRIGEGLGTPAEVTVVTGNAVDALTEVVNERSITDIIMASHGRTGLSRVILGSVAAALIHRLHCPIVVVPALAACAGDPGAQAGGTASAKRLSDHPLGSSRT
jgi:nucleotide-binding universal stress UspA family protein